MARVISAKVFRNLIKQTAATRGEVFALTRKACDYAAIIPAFKAFTHKIQLQSINIPSIQSVHFPLTLKSDIHTLSENVQRYEQNPKLFQHVFKDSTNFAMNAYSMSVTKHGIAGYVDIENIPYFHISSNDLKSGDNEWNELASIYVLLLANKDKFKMKRIRIYCDNANVIDMLQQFKAKQKRPELQSPITKIADLCLKYQINPYWSRINGVHMVIADRLARCISDPFQYSSYKPQSKPNQNVSGYLTQFKELQFAV